MSFIEMSGIVKSFGAIRALDGMDFSAEKGEIHGLAGANGSGKSTLAHILAGIVVPDSGKVMFDGLALKMGDVPASHARGIGVTYQECQAISGMTVGQTLMLGREPRGRFGVINEWSINEAAAVFLNKIGLGDIPAGARINSLSGQDIKMAEIARAILLGEKTAVFDESETDLDRAGRKKFGRIIRSLKEKGVTVILVSHDSEFLLSLCGRITVMRNGKRFSTVDASITDKGELLMLTGEKTAEIPPRTTAPGIDLVEVPCGGWPAPRLRFGEVTGVEMADGEPKASLIKTLLGIDPGVKGDITILGFTMHTSLPGGAVKHRVGLSSDERKLRGSALYFTVRKKTAYAKLEHAPISMGNDSPFSGMFGLGKRSDPLRETIAQARELFVPSEIYGGRAPADLIFKDTDTVIFDEPSRSADESTKSEIYALMAELAKRGKAILVISARGDELEFLCDRITVTG